MSLSSTAAITTKKKLTKKKIIFIEMSSNSGEEKNLHKHIYLLTVLWRMMTFFSPFTTAADWLLIFYLKTLSCVCEREKSFFFTKMDS
jgi:hypothetical protein